MFPPLTHVPEGEWFCPECEELGNYSSDFLLLNDGVHKSAKIIFANGIKSIKDNPNDIEVRVIVNTRRYVPPTFANQFSFSFLQKLKKSKCAEHLIDADFDEYNCSVCRCPGDVFFCDTCPKLFHEKCIPYGPAKLSFERGDTIWNCHKCIQNGLRYLGSRSQRSRKKCVVCKKIGGKMDQCSHCSNYFHPFCSRFQSVGAPLCSSCQHQKSMKSKLNESPRIRTRSGSSNFVYEDKDEPIDDEEDEGEGEESQDDGAKDFHDEDDYSESDEVPEMSLAPAKRPQMRLIPVPIVASVLPKRKRYRPDLLSNGQLKPTPGFFLYLEERSAKFEKIIKRRMGGKKYKKLPKIEQNVHLAKEAAICWSREALKIRRHWDSKLTPELNASIREWVSENASDVELAYENGRKKRQSKIVPKQVPVKRQKVLAGAICFERRDRGGNSIFHDLLQDDRFHPLPIFGRRGGSISCERLNHSKMTIPKFFVQGPFSSSLGDDCIGCTRGWCHFCPVLKRMLPAVEHRAKLQPPTTTLVATRIALGNKSDNLFEKDIYLSEPKKRGEDVGSFVIELSKSNQYRNKNTGLKDIDLGTGIGKCYRCKCGAVAHSMKGCNLCCRKLLSKEWSKLPAPEVKKDENEDFISNGYVTVESVALLRAPMIENTFDEQREHDQNIASMLCHQKWKPIKVLSGDRGMGEQQERKASPDNSESRDSTTSVDIHGNGESLENSTSNGIKNDSNGIGVTRRSKRSSDTIVEKDSAERAEEEKARQEAINDLNRKCRAISLLGTFLAIARRDPLRLFAEPVPPTVVGYHERIRNPMDMGTIRMKVLNDDYSGLSGLVNDIKLLCNNAMTFNLPNSVYYKTATVMLNCLDEVVERAKSWEMSIKAAHSSSSREAVRFGVSNADPFEALRSQWSGAAEVLDDYDRMKNLVQSDFFRSKENESALYGAMVVRRAAMAAATSISSDISPVICRSVREDDEMRRLVNNSVASLASTSRLLDEPGWRDSSLLQYLHSVQNRRVEVKGMSKSGCARCDDLSIKEDTKLAMMTEVLRNSRCKGKNKKMLEDKEKGKENKRCKVVPSRLAYSLTSQSTVRHYQNKVGSDVSVRGSGIHGWGLFADRPFKSGEIVAEYLGEYVTNAMADKRELIYQESRIQDYQFRVSSDLVIDATLQGDLGRYINHSCTPSCIAKIVDGDEPNKHLRRVLIIAQRDILRQEEITYDYQFPLELDLEARIPCNCASEKCRGFMNWDLPECGSVSDGAKGSPGVAGIRARSTGSSSHAGRINYSRSP